MLVNTQRIIAFTLTTFLATTALSAPIPRGCEVKGFAYNDNDLVLNADGDQKFYLLQNHSNQSIEIERHETKDVFMSPKLHSKLDPSSWSAFASDVMDLHFKCYTQDGENTISLNCSDVLDICQYPRVKFALSNMGNYWVSTNKEQRLVIKDATAKGIFLHW